MQQIEMKTIELLHTIEKDIGRKSHANSQLKKLYRAEN